MIPVLVVGKGRFPCESLGLALRRTGVVRVVGWADARTLAAGIVGVADARVLLVDAATLDAPADALCRARIAAPAAKLVLLSRETDEETVEEAVRHGADAVIARSVTSDTLAVLLRELARGTIHVRPAPERARAGRPAALAVLTPREHEILVMLADGARNAEIAASLQVSEQTVKFHVSNVFRKIGASNRTEACRWAIREGLVRPEPGAAYAAARAA